MQTRGARTFVQRGCAGADDLTLRQTESDDRAVASGAVQTRPRAGEAGVLHPFGPHGVGRGGRRAWRSVLASTRIVRTSDCARRPFCNPQAHGTQRLYAVPRAARARLVRASYEQTNAHHVCVLPAFGAWLRPAWRCQQRPLCKPELSHAKSPTIVARPPRVTSITPQRDGGREGQVRCALGRAWCARYGGSPHRCRRRTILTARW